MTHAYQLILLRHAKAEPGDGLADHLRPLALSGRRQASDVGVGLRDAGLVPDRVLVSSAIRTRQTWDLVRAGLDVPADLAEVSDAVYEAAVRSLVELVQGTDPAVRTLLVVGHEPTVSQTAATLADAATSDPVAFARVRIGVPTAAYCVLVADRPFAEWAAGSVRLTSVVSPN